MYATIKQLADEAIALQNKNRMDEVLREISSMCHEADISTQAFIATGTQALMAAQCDAIETGTGCVSVSYSDDAEITVTHVPVEELHADAAPAKAKKGGKP